MPIPHIVVGQKVAPGLLQRAKELRRNMTPAERRLWAALRGGRLDGLHFRRQQVIDGYVADFYCRAADLVVEVDGSVHDQPAQAADDAERDRYFKARGLQVLRFCNQEVQQDLPAVLFTIHLACQG
jgi:very-short-patch-repair endonuclease